MANGMKYVLVDCVSQFHMQYVVEVPEDVEEGMVFVDGTRSFPCTPEDYAMDSVTCEDVREFTQKHIGETIVDAREIKLNEAIALFRKKEPNFSDAWDDQTIIKNCITEVGYKGDHK